MMYGSRIRITGKLELLSDLHIGAGLPEISEADGERRERAVVQRGHDGAPMIPATTLKGALRQALANPDDALGSISDHRAGSGKAARLWLENAIAAGGFKAEDDKHVAIDRETGAALDNHLFTREMIRPGARFAFAADWLGDDDAKLAETLAPLAAGLFLGKGTSKGHGRVRLDAATLVIATIAPDDHGNLAETVWDEDRKRDFIRQMNQHAPHSDERIVTLTLTCEGPFISIREIGAANNKKARNTAQPLKRDGKPWLHPESLIGAMRSRAAWLAEVARAKEPDTAARDNGIPMGDRKLKNRRMSDKDELSWVERLFGVTGLRAGLRVISLECTQAGAEIVLTSNSLDRVTGATREGFLFQRTCYWEPVFKARLALPPDAPAEFKGLLHDLKTNGLELGHATTKGFGWFGVEINEESGHE